MAKKERSTRKQGTRKREPIGEESTSEGATSQTGQESSTLSPRKRRAKGEPLYKRTPFRYGSDRSHLASRPGGPPPKNVNRHGKNTVKGRVHVNSAVKGNRPTPAEIKAWCDKRKHIEFWRNRDGSYEALVTFKGATAYEQIARAIRRIPGHPYFNVKFYHKEELNDPGDTKFEKVQLRGSGPMYLKVYSSPTVRGLTPDDGLAWANVFVFDGDPRLYRRRIGLSVYWPPED